MSNGNHDNDRVSNDGGLVGQGAKGAWLRLRLRKRADLKAQIIHRMIVGTDLFNELSFWCDDSTATFLSILQDIVIRDIVGLKKQSDAV
jgi:hypothetical protein